MLQRYYCRLLPPQLRRDQERGQLFDGTPMRLDNATVIVHGQDQYEVEKISQQPGALDMIFIWSPDYQHDSSRQRRVLCPLHAISGPDALGSAAAWSRNASGLQLRYRCTQQSCERFATLCGCTAVNSFLVSALCSLVDYK